MDFSEKMKYVREQLFFSQELLARELEVSFATINRLENRKTEPSMPTKRKFLELCKKNKIKFPEDK